MNWAGRIDFVGGVLLTDYMNPRTFSLPAEYEPRLESELASRGFSLNEPRTLAEAVRRLSDHYTQNPLSSSPWSEPWAQAASIAYYFPLNYARNLAVAQEAKRLGFFAGISGLLDVGSGMGAGLFAYLDTTRFKQILAVDVDRSAIELGWQLRGETYEVEILPSHARFDRRPQLADPPSLLLTASYVRTEMEKVPDWWFEPEALAIVEPSTKDDARNLMEFRSELIDRGYSIWGPCTHQAACPQLIHSARDWCHDRIHWEPPTWFVELEKGLPMKNRTLTFSYLLARKTKRPPASLKSLARLTGDILPEKGKTRHSVCRSDEREFLAWFPQRMAPGPLIQLERGSLVELGSDLSKKSDEIRISTSSEIRELDPQEEID